MTLSLKDSILNSIQRIVAIIVKELRQLSRDKPTFGMIIMVPLIQLLLFGYAINTNIRNLPVAYVDLSQSMMSRNLMADIAAAQVVDFKKSYQSPQQADEAIRKGEVRAVLIIPHDFTTRLQDDSAVAQWLVDGSDSMVSGALLGLSTMPLTNIITTTATPQKNTFEMSLFFNPERRSVVNVVPGLVAVVLTMTMVLFTSIAIVRERERGNLELLITTPVHSLELMIGKIVPYIFVGLIQVAIILGLGHLIFDVPINGRLDQVYFAALAFISASLTLGLLISTIAKNQLQRCNLHFSCYCHQFYFQVLCFPTKACPLQHNGFLRFYQQRILCE